jgi:hypothetical protein
MVPMRLLLCRLAFPGLLLVGNVLECFVGGTGAVKNVATFIHHSSAIQAYRGNFRSTVSKVVDTASVLPTTSRTKTLVLRSPPAGTTLAGMSQIESLMQTANWLPALILCNYICRKTAEFLLHVVQPRFSAWIQGNPHTPSSSNKFTWKIWNDTITENAASGLVANIGVALWFVFDWKYSVRARLRYVRDSPTTFDLWSLFIWVLLKETWSVLLFWQTLTEAWRNGRRVCLELSSRSHRRKTLKELVVSGDFTCADRADFS